MALLLQRFVPWGDAQAGTGSDRSGDRRVRSIFPFNFVPAEQENLSQGGFGMVEELPGVAGRGGQSFTV